MSRKKISVSHFIDAIVGKHIKEYRMKKNESQKSLAAKLNMTFQQIQKYESGKNRVSASVLYEIAKVLNTPITYFFHTSESIFASLGIENRELLCDSAPGSEYVADEKSIINYFMKIRDEKVKESVVKLLKDLAEF